MIQLQEARKILGKKYEHLKDREIESIVTLLYKLCKQVINDIISTKP